MTWRDSKVASDGTHHILGGEPLYTERFGEVLKFHAPGLAPVRRGDEAWHIRLDGTEAYRRRFTRSFGFYEGLAAVVGPDGWHHIRPDGADLDAARYAWCGNFQGGRCAVRDSSGAYFHLAADGVPAYAERWRYAGDFRDGVGVVQADDGQSTHVDLDGQPIHGRWFRDLDVFHKGFARAQDAAGWHHIDQHGRPSSARRFAAVEPFYNGQARVERFDGGLEVIDERGLTLLELRPTPLAPPIEGPVLARTAWGCVQLAEAPGAQPHIVKWTRGSNERELEVLVALRGQPGVPRLYGRHRYDQNDHLHLELCAGGQVGEPRDLPVYPESEAVRITVSVLRVCEAMHARGWVHTDIHPGNVLRGDPATLLDFACAVRATYDAPWCGQINWGAWEYVPPEQLADYAVIDPSVDVYAAACLCIAMVNGAPPVRCPANQLVADGGWPAVRTAFRSTGVEAALSTLREPLRHALAAAVAADRRDRPTAQALAEALSHV